jgi:hypothetical protein
VKWKNKKNREATDIMAKRRLEEPRDQIHIKPNENETGGNRRKRKSRHKLEKNRKKPEEAFKNWKMKEKMDQRS